MEWHNLLLFLHVLLFVFWLGTDVGVFLAAKISEKGELSTETRSTVLGLGMVLDRLPRSALILIFPTGLQLSVNTGQLDVASSIVVAVWAVALVWLAILWLGFMKPQTPTEQRAMLFNFAMNALLAIVVTGYGLYLWLGDHAAAWVAFKVLVVGLIFVAGVLLDALFKPAVEAFVDIVTNGGSAERDEKYARAISPVYKIVLAIYVLVMVAAYLGLAKPLI
ncbi:MAG: hypothetical protein AAF417_18420 [Pseudomonadota bacterium]